MKITKFLNLFLRIVLVSPLVVSSFCVPFGATTIKMDGNKPLVSAPGMANSESVETINDCDAKKAVSNVEKDLLDGNEIDSSDQFKSYLDFTARKEAIRSFVVFKSLDDVDIAALADSLVQIVVKPGDKIVTQGDTATSMYIVKSGALQCFDGLSGKSLIVVKTGDYFGELGLFLKRKRAASIRGMKVDEPTIVWKLGQQFTKNIAVGKDLEKYLLKRYGSKRTFSDMVSLAKLKLRPKRKRVGLHSTLSVFTVGACFVNLVSLASPHTRPCPNIFQLTDMGRANHLQSLVCSFLLFWVMVLGTLRLPQRTRYTRKVSFNTISAVQLWKVPLSFSNVAGNHPFAIIDAWSPVGRLLIGATYVTFSIMNFLLLDVVIAGEEDGREANPFFENMGRGLMASFLNFFAVLRLWLLSCTVFDSKAKAATVISTLYPLAGITPSWVANVNFMSFLYLSMGALFATFQYEKRFPQWATNLMLGVTATVLLGDTFGCSFPLMYGGKVSSELVTYWVSLIKGNPFLQLYVFTPIAGALYGIYSRFKNKGRRPSSI